MDGGFIVIIYLSPSHPPSPSLSFLSPALLALSRWVLMRAGSADGCEIELSPPPSQLSPLTCKGFNDHESGKHSKWQTLN